MIELTQDQHDALSRNGSDPVRVIDPLTSLQYVLLPADVYERLKGLLADDMPNAAALINEVMAEDDSKDPYLESYQHYARQDR